ncbi:hypothetical protein M9458_037366 [Cirrhinus mrigala]|uniref:Uncharacterized protein n=1 Tax=Cirrhinus mrigala TaxID=683832 RepID=A0ABD0NVN2_CIRMR
MVMLEKHSFEDHTTDFVFLANLTHYPDNCLCSFYHMGLNTATRAQLLAAYVEWVLVSCRSSLTVDITDDNTSPTLDPEPRQLSPQFMEHEPEPTATDEPSPNGPDPITSNQVQEPATSLAMEEVSVEHEDAKEGPAHCTYAEGELKLELGQMDLINFDEDIYADMPPLLPPSKLSYDPEPSVCPDLSACLDFPPTLPLLPHTLIPASATPPLSPDSPSAHPQPTICAVGSPRVCQFLSVSWLEDPSSPPLASESWTLPWPTDPAAPSSLPSPVDPPAPPGSLVPLAPPWSVVVPPSPQDSTPLAGPRRSVPPAPLGSSLPPASPQSSVTPAQLWASGSQPLLRSPEPWTPPWPSRSSVLAGLDGFPSPSPPRAPPPLAPPLSVGPLESSAPHPPWLLPLLALPWAAIMAAAWVSPGSSCSRSLLSPPWLLPLSDQDRPWTLLSSPMAPPSIVTTIDSVCCPPPKSPSSARASACTDFLLPYYVHSFVHLLSPLRLTVTPLDFLYRYFPLACSAPLILRIIY